MKHTTHLLIVTVLAFFISLVAMAKPNLVDVANVGFHPESTTGDGHYIYVSNMGEKADFTKSGDGYVSRLSLEGKVLEAKFLPTEEPLHSPTGMTVVAGWLVVNDLDRVVVFDLKTRKQRLEISLASLGVEFLNDITYLGGPHFVVSATRNQKLFLVDVSRRSVRELKVDRPLHFVNGLDYDLRTGILYLNENLSTQMGKDDSNGVVYAIRLDTQSQTGKVLWTARNQGKFLDGIVRLRDGSVLISDWGGYGPDGNLRLLFPNGAKKPQKMDLRIKGMADFYLDDRRNRIYIPQLTEGTVTVMDL